MTIAQSLKNLYDNLVLSVNTTNEFTEALPDCYDAVEDKGGTLPAQQTAANLPTAIASIPQGCGLYYNMNSFGFSDSVIEQMNNSVNEDIATSLQYIGVKKTDIPYVVVNITKDGESSSTEWTTRRTLQNAKNVLVAYINGGMMSTGNYTFTNCNSLLYVIIGNVTGNVTNALGMFQSCYSLRAVYGTVVITGCSNYTNNFNSCWNLREINIDYQVDHDFTISDPPLNLESLLFLLDHLVTSTNSSTLTIGATNLATLNATAEGQAAITAAMAKGWQIV